MENLNQIFDIDTDVGPKSTDTSEAENLEFSFEILREFLRDWRAYTAETLRPYETRLSEIFKGWSGTEHWQKLVSHSGSPIPSPVQRTPTRIKGTREVVRKILAKPESFPDGLTRKSFEHMCDALGARVVVYFLSGLPLIDKEIRECGLFEVSKIKPPVAYLPKDVYDKLGLTMKRASKPSGYMSIHYVLRLKKSATPEGRRPWFELQVRTLTQDIWAEVEHLLGYKHAGSSPQLESQFKLISKLLGTIDGYFDNLQSDLSRLQNRWECEDSEPLTVDNLPFVLSKSGLSCSQYDLKGLLKMANSCGIASVGDFKTVASTENLEIVRSASKNALGREPLGSEIVVALSLLFGKRTATTRTEKVKGWSEFRDVIGDA